MLTKEELETLARIPIQEMDPKDLSDLLDVKITGETPAQRLESYFSQVANPYCFRVGKIPVRISYNADEKPLEEKLKAHFLAIKRGDYR